MGNFCQDIIEEYKGLEPEGTDSWNVFNNLHQYWHRYRLMSELKTALKMVPTPISDIKVLEIGCGSGKSSRVLLEFGVCPQNITALDIRPDAIQHAKSINSNINYICVDGFNGWPSSQHFDFVMQCTVFSSIKNISDRKLLASQIQQCAPDAYFYWWDLEMANHFAGGDLLRPEDYFSSATKKVFGRKASLRPTILEAIRGLDKIDLGHNHYEICTFFGLLSPLTHMSILYKFIRS